MDNIHLQWLLRIQDSNIENSSDCQLDSSEIDRQDNIIKECEVFLQGLELKRNRFAKKSKKQWQDAEHVLSGKQLKQNCQKAKTTWKTQTEGISKCELDRRKAAHECQRGSWLQDRQGSLMMTDCFRWKCVEKRTAPFPKARQHQQDWSI